MRTTGKQCGLAATGVYQPSLRSPWLAAKVGRRQPQLNVFGQMLRTLKLGMHDHGAPVVFGADARVLNGLDHHIDSTVAIGMNVHMNVQGNLRVKQLFGDGVQLFLGDGGFTLPVLLPGGTTTMIGVRDQCRLALGGAIDSDLGSLKFEVVIVTEVSQFFGAMNIRVD